MKRANRLWVSLMTIVFAGCAEFRHTPPVPACAYNERERAVMDEYVIDPPDILAIDLLNPVPKPPYRVQPLDSVALTIAGTPDDEPVSNVFPVDPAGTITVGGRYGTFALGGMTLAEAKQAIETQLADTIKKPKVTIQVAQSRAAQPVRGPHLVRPDGHVSLGGYGSVRVAGMTLTQAKAVIEAKLSETLLDPVVAVDVQGYNSKTYYVIFDFGGAGQQIRQLPITGNETVLDAMAQMNGLSVVSDPARMFVARSACAGQPDQVLPVDWPAITLRGRPETNYQLVPGDRVYVQSYPLVSADIRLARILSPVERLLGVTLLGSTTVREVRNIGQTGTGIAP
jgi:polysaccharide biosynthesis/export protein